MLLRGLVALVCALVLLPSVALGAEKKPEPAKPGKKVEVIDNNGTVVGEVISVDAFSPQPIVLIVLRVHDTGALLRVLPYGLFGIAMPASLFFESADCSSAPLILTTPGINADALFPLTFVTPALKLYVADMASPQSTTIRASSEDGVTCTPVSSFSSDVLPTLPPVDLQARLTRPFSLRFK